MNVKVQLRTPAGTPQFRLIVGEWVLLQTRTRKWRVVRNRKGATWAVSTRPGLLGAVVGAWRNRGYYPHDVYR
jgi:hypothetical protein